MKEKKRKGKKRKGKRRERREEKRREKSKGSKSSECENPYNLFLIFSKKKMKIRNEKCSLI